MISDSAKANPPKYDFSQPAGRFADREDPIFAEIIGTRAFQRLKQVRFLGGIDYVLVRAPNGNKGNIRYTRFQHSLGVTRLASMYSIEQKLSFDKRRIVLLAALLHDVGHAPFSHSLEPTFMELFGLNHHRATEDIITGREKIGRGIFEILHRYHVKIDDLLSVIAGKETDYDNFFSGPINFDTIEGILRSYAYTKPNPITPNPEDVTKAAITRGNENDRAKVDGFWWYKDQVYRHIINSTEGLLADRVCQLFMRRHLNKIGPEDYFSTEPRLFKKLDGLREVLFSRSFRSLAAKLIDAPLKYKERRFFVNYGGDFFARDDFKRYMQTKSEVVSSLQETPDLAEIESAQDLIDESNKRSPTLFER
jgi:hypothetical protein